MITLKSKSYTYRATFTNPGIGAAPDSHTINHNLGAEFLDFYATVKITDGRHVSVPDQEYAGSHYRGCYTILSVDKMTTTWTGHTVAFMTPGEQGDLVVVLLAR